jgi:hypothetical protein
MRGLSTHILRHVLNVVIILSCKDWFIWIRSVLQGTTEYRRLLLFWVPTKLFKLKNIIEHYINYSNKIHHNGLSQYLRVPGNHCLFMWKYLEYELCIPKCSQPWASWEFIPGPARIPQPVYVHVAFINGVIFAQSLHISSYMLYTSPDYLYYLIQGKFYIYTCYT